MFVSCWKHYKKSRVLFLQLFFSNQQSYSELYIFFTTVHWYDLQCVLAGFLKKEIEKADIHVSDTGENPEAPHPREMIDLEVS